MKNIYKSISLSTFLFTLLFLGSGCMSAYSKRILVNVDPSADKAAKTIREEVRSDLTLLFGVIPLAKTGTPDIKSVLATIQKKHKCQELRNIDIEYYNLSYIIVGYPKLVITADCIEEGGIFPALGF